MKSGLAQLREEKYRFTVETQGLSYTTKHYNAGAQDEDTVWTDDDEDIEEKRCETKRKVTSSRRSKFLKKLFRRKSPPVAQRMATELTKILQEVRAFRMIFQFDVVALQLTNWPVREEA